MNDRLQAQIEGARDTLGSLPDGVLAGKVELPARSQWPPAWSPWSDYYEFLRVADGATFGSVDLWSLDELVSRQYPTTDMPGGSAEWLVVGQVLYEPLALHAPTKELRLFPRDGPVAGDAIGMLDDFLDSLFSPAYARLVDGGEDDDWWSYLKEAGLRGAPVRG